MSNQDEMISQAISEVEQKLRRNILIQPRELLYKLGASMVKESEFKALVVRSYAMAKKRNNWQWVVKAQTEATPFFSTSWILENLPHKFKNCNRVSLPKKRAPARAYCTQSRDIRYYGDSESSVPLTSIS